MAKEHVLQRIKARLAELGLSPNAASVSAGLSREMIRKMGTGNSTSVMLDTVERLAPVLKTSPAWLAFGTGDANAREGVPSPLPLVGTVSGGVWREVDSLDQDEKPASPFLPDPRWPADKQFALKIEGESINRVARDGDIIAVVDVHALQTQVADDALVVVEESRDGGLIRTTAKRLRRRGKLTELHADSDDPRWRDVRLIIEPDTDDARLITTRIVGLVTAVQKALA